MFDGRNISIDFKKDIEVTLNQESVEDMILCYLSETEGMHLRDAKFNYCVTESNGTQQLKVTVTGQED